MPSHRADTPADAPTALDLRPPAHPSSHPPLQRRRDLRARGTAGGGARAATAVAHRPSQQGRLDWLEEPAAHVPGQRELGTPPAGLPVPAADPSPWAVTPAAPPAPAPATPAATLDAVAGLGGPRRESARLRAARERARVEAPVPVPPAAGDFAAALSERAPWADAGTTATTGTVDAPTVGAPALDPLFLATPRADGDEGATAPVQPLRRPRGKERAQAQTTRRAARPVPAVGAPERAPGGRRGTTSAIPQAGIAGALGLVTIAVPLCSALGVGPVAQAATGATKGTANTAAAAAVAPLPPFPLVAAPPLNALADRRLLPDETPVAEVPAALAAPRIRLTSDGRASRSNARGVLPGCDGKVPDVTGVQNGRLPASMLCTLWDKDQQLRSDAAVAIAKLNIAYTKRFGHPMCFNDAYRSLAEQYQIKARRGGYAARPGTSEHGWGLAVDLCDGVDQGPRSATYSWLRANAPAYGWENPLWARGGGGPYEPWHWEYMPGTQGQTEGD